MFVTEKDHYKPLVIRGNLTGFIALLLLSNKKKPPSFSTPATFNIYGGADGTRTRDLQRDRLAF
jgi:hypothetical protein